MDGSGGTGRFRGGRRLRRAYRAEAECQLRLDASLGALWRSSGERGALRIGDGVEPFVKGHGILRPGEPVEIVTPGAGGCGAPAERDPIGARTTRPDERIDLAVAATTRPEFQR